MPTKGKAFSERWQKPYCTKPKPVPKRVVPRKYQRLSVVVTLASSVIGFAKRRNVDTIVVGTRGLGKVREILMGSVSRKLANSAEANCLIVR